jgi:hypothetical protein
MRKAPLIGSALIVLLGGVGMAGAQRGTSYDWNELSTPQADFMAQQRVERNIGNRHAAAGGMSTSSKPANASVPRGGDPPGVVSLTKMDKSAIVRGAIARPQSAPSDFHPSMGATVPRSMELYAFDDRVQSLTPAAQKYDYVKLEGNNVLLVDPASRTVVAMVEQKDATQSK